MSSLPSDQTQLVDLVTTVLDRIERGEEPRIEEVCRDHPQWIEKVREAVQTAFEIEDIDLSDADGGLHQGRVLLDRYRLESPLGAGSMGAVYTAWDQELDRPVAAKLLQSELWDGPEAEARFEREARALAAIRHPSVVTVHDRGQTDDDLQFLVMELLVGSGLDSILRDAHCHGTDSYDSIVRAAQSRLGEAADLESSDFRQIARWARDIARGLEAAHRVGVLHRDVKPSNVFIRADGSAVLIDFGIASDRSDRTLALGNTVLGTPAYMPPEALQPNHTASAVTDVYGLGATLYHLVALRQPFEGTPSQVIDQLPRREPPAIQNIRSRVPRDLRAIVEMSMSPIHSRRYPEAAELADDLEAFLHHQPIKARPRTKLDRAWSRLRRSSELRVAIAVGLVALLTVLGYQWWATVQVERVRTFDTALLSFPPSLLTATISAERDAAPIVIEAAEASLQRAVQSGAYAALALGYRGMARVGYGETEGAARDFKRAHALAQDPVFADLAQRVTDSGSDAFYAPPLPPASSDAGAVVQAIHLVQTPHELMGTKEPDSVQRAIDLLGRQGLEDLPGVADLRLMARGTQLERSAGRVRNFDAAAALQQMREDALRLESRNGGPSPTTGLVRGNAHSFAGRHRSAIVALRQAVELCPTSASIRTALAKNLRATGDVDGAVEQLAHARRLRPNSVKIWRRYVRILARARKFEEARRQLELQAEDVEQARAPFRPKLRGLIAAHEAIAALVAGDTNRSRGLAEQAIDTWTSETRDRSSLESDRDYLLLTYLARGQQFGVLQLVMLRLRNEPLDRHTLTAIQHLLRDSPGERLFQTYIGYLLRTLGSGQDN